jgi:hypothetical protein
MKDYKNCRYVEPTPIEEKIVHGSAFIAVLLALIVWL